MKVRLKGTWEDWITFFLKGISETSKEAANELIKKFEKVGVLKEIMGKQRYKIYSFKEYINIIARETKDKS